MCGFYRSNGTPLAPSPRSSPWRRIHLSDGVRGPPLGVYSGVPGAAGSVCGSVHQQREAERAATGVGGTPRRRRRAVSVAQRPRDPGSWHSARPVHVPPPATAEAGAATASGGDDTSRRRRRTLPRAATAAAALWFQSQGQRQWGTAVAHARRHKHRSTAAATTAHVVHRSLHCTRDRERCTES